ncbi:hypothetical protein U9M48_041733, partial [Paspalum notatum var. saurae]
SLPSSPPTPRRRPLVSLPPTLRRRCSRPRTVRSPASPPLLSPWIGSRCTVRGGQGSPHGRHCLLPRMDRMLVPPRGSAGRIWACQRLQAASLVVRKPWHRGGRRAPPRQSGSLSMIAAPVRLLRIWCDWGRRLLSCLRGARRLTGRGHSASSKDR